MWKKLQDLAGAKFHSSRPYVQAAGLSEGARSYTGMQADASPDDRASYVLGWQ
jgi:hypothetical protein